MNSWTNDAGAGAEEALRTITAALEAIERADTTGHQCFDALEASKDRLAGVIGGGNAIPHKVQETYSLNGKAHGALNEMHVALETAAHELRQFLPALT